MDAQITYILKHVIYIYCNQLFEITKCMMICDQLLYSELQGAWLSFTK